MDDTLDALRSGFTGRLLTDAPDMVALLARDPCSLIHPAEWLGGAPTPASAEICR